LGPSSKKKKKNAVVDPELKVYGVNRMTVVDISITPFAGRGRISKKGRKI
jgi:hypothetical protein